MRFQRGILSCWEQNSLWISSWCLWPGSAGVTFLAICYKKGSYFQLDETWLTSVIIPAMPCASQPCRKGRRGKSCRWRQHQGVLPSRDILSSSARDFCAVGDFFFKTKKMQPETLQQVLAWAWHLLCAVMQLRHWSCQFLIITMKGGEIKTAWDFILSYYPRIFFLFLIL